MLNRPWARCLALSAVTFAGLVAIVLWGHGWIRTHLGDTLVVPWVIHSVGIVPALAPWQRSRVAFGLSLAVGLELLQTLDRVGPGSPQWAHLIFGSTFDPLDLVHYAVGAAIAGLLELWVVRPTLRAQ